MHSIFRASYYHSHVQRGALDFYPLEWRYLVHIHRYACMYICICMLVYVYIVYTHAYKCICTCVYIQRENIKPYI